MSGPKEIKRFKEGKGLYQVIQFDESQTEEGPLSQWSSKIVCEGGGDSDPFVVPLHWHKYHDEHITVLEGRIEVTLDGKKRIVTPSDGMIVIPARAVHGFRGFTGERMVLLETTSPPGDYKARFFNDILSQADQPGFIRPGFWHAMRCFYDGDSYPALGLYFRFFDVAFVLTLGNIAKLFAPARPEKLE